MPSAETKIALAAVVEALSEGSEGEEPSQESLDKAARVVAYCAKPGRLSRLFPEEVQSGPGVGVKSLSEPHKYGCVMVNLPGPLRKEVVDWVLENVPEFHLGPGGRELSPHVTVKYGITNPDGEALPLLREVLNKFAPLRLKLDEELTIFGEGYGKWNNEDGDVLKVGVDSEQLHELNAAISSTFDCEDKFPTYQPHLTLAYLDPRVSRSYLGGASPFLGREVTAHEVVYSPPEGDRVYLPLGGLLPNLSGKAMSAYSEGTGGALVPPPEWGGSVPLRTPRRVVTMANRPRRKMIVVPSLKSLYGGAKSRESEAGRAQAARVDVPPRPAPEEEPPVPDEGPPKKEPPQNQARESQAGRVRAGNAGAPPKPPAGVQGAQVRPVTVGETARKPAPPVSHAASDVQAGRARSGRPETAETPVHAKPPSRIAASPFRPRRPAVDAAPVPPPSLRPYSKPERLRPPEKPPETPPVPEEAETPVGEREEAGAPEEALETNAAGVSTPTGNATGTPGDVAEGTPPPAEGTPTEQRKKRELSPKEEANRQRLAERREKFKDSAPAAPVRARDAEWITRMASQDPAAFDEVVTHFFGNPDSGDSEGPIRKYLRSKLKKRSADVDEIIQDVLMSLMMNVRDPKKVEKALESPNLGGYLYRIADLKLADRGRQELQRDRAGAGARQFAEVAGDEGESRSGEEFIPSGEVEEPRPSEEYDPTVDEELRAIEEENRQIRRGKESSEEAEAQSKIEQEAPAAYQSALDAAMKTWSPGNVKRNTEIMTLLYELGESSATTAAVLNAKGGYGKVTPNLVAQVAHQVNTAMMKFLEEKYPEVVRAFMPPITEEEKAEKARKMNKTRKKENAGKLSRKKPMETFPRKKPAEGGQ